MNAAILHIAPDGPAKTLKDVPPSVLKILRGALSEIARRGTRRLTMSDIIEGSGVSRGTLYRYFTTKDDVLAAVSEYVSLTFELGIREEAACYADPLDRLRAVMRYHAAYTGTQAPESILGIEPTFVLNFLKSHFDRHKQAMLDALNPAFDLLEPQYGIRIDRETLIESMIRLQLSRLLVPNDERWARIWDAAPDIFIAWIAGHRVQTS